MCLASLSGGGGMEDVLDLDDLGLPTVPICPRTPVCLAGKLCVEKAYNMFAAIDVMTKAFRSKGRITAREWGNGKVIFSFERENDRQWVLRNQPWHFDGHLFAIRVLTGMEQPSSMSISLASF